MNAKNLIGLEALEIFFLSFPWFSLHAKNPGISYIEWFLAMALPHKKN